MTSMMMKKLMNKIVQGNLLKLTKLFARTVSRAAPAVVLENHCWDPKKTENSQDIRLKLEGFGPSN